MTIQTRATGTLGEDLAAGFLARLGYAVLTRNYRHGTLGEIDIVAQDGEDLVFCEVKTRASDEFGDPAYAVTPRKQAQLRKLAAIYLGDHGMSQQACRFDVVTIRLAPVSSGRPAGEDPLIEHFKNAF